MRRDVPHLSRTLQPRNRCGEAEGALCRKGQKAVFWQEGNEFWVKENNKRPLHQPTGNQHPGFPRDLCIFGTSESISSFNFSRCHECTKVPLRISDVLGARLFHL